VVELSVCYVDLDGEKVSQAEYCRRLGYSYNAIQGIMHRYNISFEEAVEEYLKPKNERKWAKRVSKDKRFYNIWWQMMDRCYNPKNPSYPKYGGRKPKSIQVCDRWQDYFNFEDDMYDKYIKHCEEYSVKQTTIDRFPNKLGNYEPSNTRWATYKEQANNKTDNHMITNDLNLMQFCEKHNLSYRLICRRLYDGWTLEESIYPSLRDNHKIFAPTGENLDELAKRLNVCVSTLKSRYNRGWEWNKIINTPIQEKILAPTGETLHELSEKIGVPYNALKARYENGWDWNKIVNTPFGGDIAHAPTGETILEVAKRLGMCQSTIRRRLKRGWTWDMIFDIPNFITFPTGETVAQIARRLSVSTDSIYRRLKDGYSWEEIEANPCKRRKNIICPITGETLKELSDRLCVPVKTLSTRYYKGWSWDEILNPSLRKKK